eukprot:Rhum_TRINITY_DN15140_c5_g2::Rhum_TRINITY_DN15140_c5_g2_i4::g.140483::m.140483
MTDEDGTPLRNLALAPQRWLTRVQWRDYSMRRGRGCGGRGKGKGVASDNTFSVRGRGSYAIIMEEGPRRRVERGGGGANIFLSTTRNTRTPSVHADFYFIFYFILLSGHVDNYHRHAVPGHAAVAPAVRTRFTGGGGDISTAVGEVVLPAGAAAAVAEEAASSIGGSGDGCGAARFRAPPPPVRRQYSMREVMGGGRGWFAPTTTGDGGMRYEGDAVGFQGPLETATGSVAAAAAAEPPSRREKPKVSTSSPESRRGIGDTQQLPPRRVGVAAMAPPETGSHRGESSITGDGWCAAQPAIVAGGWDGGGGEVESLVVLSTADVRCRFLPSHPFDSFFFESALEEKCGDVQ